MLPLLLPSGTTCRVLRVSVNTASESTSKVHPDRSLPDTLPCFGDGLSTANQTRPEALL